MAGKIPRAVGHFAIAVSLKSDEDVDGQTIKKDFHSHSTMKRLSLIVLFAFATLNTPFAQSQPGAPNPAQAWWAHVQFLADDKMAGRDTGSPEHRKAADYVAAAFKRAGLKPAGAKGYLQPVNFISRRVLENECAPCYIRFPVNFISRRVLENECSMALVRNGQSEDVALGDEAVFSMSIAHAPRVEAPLVFVGYGLTIPEAKRDDLAGLDLRGKVVVLLTGGPPEISGPLKAHYQSHRWEALKRAGVIGVIGIQNPRGQDIPWDRSKLARFRPRMALADASLSEDAGQQLAVTFNSARAEKLLAGSGHTFAEILALADAGKPLPHFALPASVRAQVKFEQRNLVSHNVVGLLTGADPKLKNEYVVLSAHLDHIGAGQPINGDGIYNGAMDNASGVATLIEAAMALAKTPLRRSVLFVAVTAEESGLLGSKYFAARPTVPANALVANVNVDMFLPLFPLRSLIVQGLEESDLADDLQAAGRELQLQILSDPEPERNAFTRSDQYSFIQRGLPSASLKVGFTKGTPEHEIVKRWRAERYHAPSDDLQQPIDF